VKFFLTKMGINSILNCVKTLRTRRTTLSLLIFTFIVLLSPFSRAQDNLPNSNPNSPPRSGKAPVFIPGNARPIQNLGPQILGDLTSFRQELMYPYNLSDFTEITSAKPIHDQPLPFRLPFFGFSYHYIWIQRDGYLAFNRGLLSYKFPMRFPFLPRDRLLEEDPSIIAPWFALQDIPTEVPNAGVYLKIVNLESEWNITLRERIYADFREGMIGAADFKPKFAIIVTWRNMTMVNRRPEMPLVTNTYQCIVATDEIRTYVMFNYEQIQWITHEDNYIGLKGSAAYVGFNAGNTTRTFEFRPYSQNPRISYLTTRGWGNGLRGRYFFQIDEEVWPGSCIEKDLDPNLPDRLPLTFFPRVGHMLGGTLVNFTGPCLSPNSIITCKFENWRTQGIYRDFNHATCISPPVMYHGYIDLTITVDDRTLFLGRFYKQPPDIADDDVVVLDNADRLEEPTQLEIKWKPHKLAWDDNTRITMSLWGYRETGDVYPSLTYIDTLADPGSLRLGQIKATIDPSLFRDRKNYDTTDLIFGFIAINLTDSTILGKDIKQSPIIWSRPMPLAWYFKRQWEREYGGNGRWKEHFCHNWFQRESYNDRFATTVFRCPCTLQQAQLDRGRFSPDLECNVVDRKCDTFHRGAQHCVKTGRPSIGGSGQTCCYDDYNELLQTADTMYGGRPSRAFVYGKQPFKMRMMIPALSEWLHDTMPFFFCCKWQPKEDNAHTCQMYNYWRTSQDCSSYQAPAIGSVYGDPHIITFDRFNYTFNGKGEYTLLHVDNPVHRIDVQARFEQVPRHRRTDPLINATALTAVAARDNISSVVEFRLRPTAARWRYHMYVIVDKEYVFWWDESMRLQNFRGVTLYQPAGIQNMSHIIAMFDSGVGVEVMTNQGHLTVHVYAPYTFLNGTAGLLGKYSREYRDDLTLPNGQAISVQSSQEDIHMRFGMSWRVLESVSIGDENRVSSLFFHDAISYSYFDDPNFIPDFGLPPRLPDWAEHLRPDMETVCSDSLPCQYDYIITLDREYAKMTKDFEAYALWLSNEAHRKFVRCPALPKPLNGRKSENRYWPGTIVRFSCDDGCRLVVYKARRCREDGLWSWGVDPKCISMSSFR
jgi:hypothetical protein